MQQIITRYYIFVCDSRSRDIFLGILYGYKALLQIIAMVFAFSIRKVKVKGLNDTKFIVAIVYVMSISTAAIIVAAYTLNTKINGYAALFSSAVVIGTTTTLGLVFVPKVRMVDIYSISSCLYMWQLEFFKNVLLWGLQYYNSSNIHLQLGHYFKKILSDLCNWH